MTRQDRPRTDEDWLERFESGEIDFDVSDAKDLRDLAEVRAYELLRREYDAAVTGSIRLSGHRGVPWMAIARAIALDESETEATYHDLIGPEAELAAASKDPAEPPDVRVIEFLVQSRDDAARRLASAIERAKDAGIDDGFIRSVVERSEEGARFAWPFRS